MNSRNEIPTKRVSNRRYLPKRCKKPECNAVFIPSDSRQKFCCQQHRIDHNNDVRKVSSKPFEDHIKKLKHNEAILKKAYNILKATGNEKAVIDLLRYEQFYEDCFTKFSKNDQTDQIVCWVNDYGIEGLKEPGSKLIIHNKK